MLWVRPFNIILLVLLCFPVFSAGQGSFDPAYTITAHGGAHLKTDQKKFGSASVYFDGATDYLSIPDHADWHLGGGTGDFTVDFWFRRHTLQYNQYFINQKLAIGQESVIDGQINFETYTSIRFNNSEFRLDTSYYPPIDTWVHFAFVRSGDTFYIFVNGDLKAQKTQTITINDGTGDFRIGYEMNNGLRGYLDEFRLSNTARWTNNFTPPTSAYSVDENTLRLIHFDGTNGSTEIEDDFIDNLPVIILFGSNPFILNVGSTFNDPGAIATDDNDDNTILTGSMVVGGLSTVDTTIPGEYIVTYDVIDSEGNAAVQVQRIVRVEVISNRLLYTGRELDVETELYYYRARYYDPEIGRFISEDPLGFIAGVNFYTYVENNPLGFNDPFGLLSYLVSRPLAGLAGLTGGTHNFVVTGADFIGQVGAPVNSFGKTDNGNLGRVTNQTTNNFSRTTSRDDIRFWETLQPESSNVTLLDAPDALVQAYADNLIENRPYSLVPVVSNLFNENGDSANSNSAAQAIANISTGTEVDIPNGFRVSPGAGQSELIEFGTLSQNIGAASGGLVIYPNKPNTNMVLRVYSK